MRDRGGAASEPVTRSADLHARLAALYEVIDETVRNSHELCDLAGEARDRARRTAARQR